LPLHLINNAGSLSYNHMHNNGKITIEVCIHIYHCHTISLDNNMNEQYVQGIEIEKSACANDSRELTGQR